MSANTSARPSITGTWTTRNSATRLTPSMNCRVREALLVVVEPDEGRAAHELLAEQAQVQRVRERRDEQREEQHHERRREEEARDGVPVAGPPAAPARHARVTLAVSAVAVA